MKFEYDSHTHTLASGHAYNTILELAKAASEKGLRLLCITDHAPGLPRTTHRDHFYNLKIVDRELYGVRMMMGAELNVMDYEGTIDLETRILSTLDMAIASMHPLCMPEGGTRAQYTEAALRVMENPYVRILGHPDDGQYPLDYEAVVRAALENHVLLEANNTSLSPASCRKNSRENLREMLLCCKRLGAPITIGSDAHFCTQVGAHDYVEALLSEVGFPEELVMNTDADAFAAFTQEKKPLH